MSTVKLAPLSWNFSTCPGEEAAFLYDYEFSRECPAVRDTVDFIRRGRVQEPAYWLPNPDFGWPEWPLEPYLSIRPAERQKRLTLLLKKRNDAILTLARLPASATTREVFSALLERIEAEQNREQPVRQRVGRAASQAKYSDQLRMLTIYRLLQHYKPDKVMELLDDHYRKLSFLSSKNLRRTAATLRGHRAGFCLIAADRIKEGRWFPPFGPYLITP